MQQDFLITTLRQRQRPRFMGVLLGDVLARRVPVSAFWRYRVSLQRKKCCQQIIGLNNAKEESVVNLSRCSLLFVQQVRLARFAR